jgi:hypothetical protein
MDHQPVLRTASSENSIWTWIILAALLVLGALTSVGALAITGATQQGQMPTGSQSVPGH